MSLPQWLKDKVHIKVDNNDQISLDELKSFVERVQRCTVYRRDQDSIIAHAIRQLVGDNTINN